MADTDKVYIFDTTLRDGEQSAGIGFSIDEKVEIAKALARLNVDIIEAGFPISSPGDLEAVAQIAKQVKGPVIAGLARAAFGDVDAVWEAVRHAESPRIHVFLSSSDIHLAQQLHKNREDVMEMARAAVSRAAGYTSDVEFSPMDATRSNPEFVYQLVQAAIEEGATTINIPDTVGYAIPKEFEAFIRSLPEHVPDMHKARISVHCQNDLGMATANSMAGILGGARQVEGTINGIGERAGNASLEEIIMAIQTRADFMHVHTDANPREIYAISQLVERASGMAIQPHKAIVGKNAFRHSSGIHQDGVLKMRETYEIMDPEAIGIPGGSSIVLTKTSGRHGLQSRLSAIGVEPADDEFQRIWEAFLDVADAKDEVDDRDLMAIVAEQTQIKIEDAWTLDLVQVSSSDHGTPTATIRLIGPEGAAHEDAAIGTGPVDAIYRAISRVTGTQHDLTEFAVKSVTEGIDAQGEVTIRIEADGIIYQGRAADTDILVASARAYLHALNRSIAAAAQRQAVPATV
ncbi:MAG: 2-isopropylmalate synthase [Chloroflexi bacterium]|nr:2-isopropylmalate synthase [Chloroflexota bacterium]MDA1145548.1 2-isopropylmalate synthase [Chloroflexota bacterium]